MEAVVGCFTAISKLHTRMFEVVGLQTVRSDGVYFVHCKFRRKKIALVVVVVVVVVGGGGGGGGRLYSDINANGTLLTHKVLKDVVANTNRLIRI